MFQLSFFPNEQCIKSNTMTRWHEPVLLLPPFVFVDGINDYLADGQKPFFLQTTPQKLDSCRGTMISLRII
jgi:hypothetical protein